MVAGNALGLTDQQLFAETPVNLPSRSSTPSVKFKRRTISVVGWSQWVDATLNSDPHSLKTKAKSAG